MERFGQDLLLLEKLAAGGMAEVHRAKQLGYGGFEKTVAVKRILPHYASSEEFKNMFRMEANLSGLLQHPNIAHVFGNGEFEGYLYLVMEFVDGRNLRQVLARADKTKTKIPIEIACYLIAEAAKGLEYAHNFADEKTGQPLEIVHRDMSPQNVMIAYDGAVKIVDFGIAKAAARADMTRAGVLKGKFGYMSPEQASGQKLDKRTDIFALGIILFETLTMRRLFTTDDDLRTLQHVRDCKVPRPSRYNPSISPTLDRIVMKALAKERADRYATAGELYADLLRFMNQTFPKFIPTELSKFMRGLFQEDIAEDKKRREKMAAEAPARVTAPVGRNEPNEAPAKAGRNAGGKREEVTAFDEEMKTQVSNVSKGSFEMNADDAPAAAPEEVEISEAAGTMVALPNSPAASPAPAAPAQQAASEVSPHDETQITGAGAEDPLPPPGEISFGSIENSGISQISLSIPEIGQTKESALPSSGGVPAKPPLTIVLNDAPYATPSAPPSRSIHSLGTPKPARGPSRRVVMYGVALMGLAALIMVQRQEQVTQGSVTAQNEAPAQAGQAAPGASGATATAPANAQAVVANQGTGGGVGGAASAMPVQPIVNEPTMSRVPAQEPSAPAPQGQTPPPPAPVAAEPTRSTASVGELQLDAVNRGYISIQSTPRATEIFLNGQLLRGENGAPLETPILRFAVPSGKGQRIQLRNRVFGVQWEQTVDVEADRILPLQPTLR